MGRCTTPKGVEGISGLPRARGGAEGVNRAPDRDPRRPSGGPNALLGPWVAIRKGGIVRVCCLRARARVNTNLCRRFSRGPGSWGPGSWVLGVNPPTPETTLESTLGRGPRAQEEPSSYLPIYLSTYLLTYTLTRDHPRERERERTYPPRMEDGSSQHPPIHPRRVYPPPRMAWWDGGGILVRASYHPTILPSTYPSTGGIPEHPPRLEG